MLTGLIEYSTLASPTANILCRQGGKLRAAGSFSTAGVAKGSVLYDPFGNDYVRFVGEAENVYMLQRTLGGDAKRSL